MPLQTELHRHLDVSLRMSTLLRLAQERGLEAHSTSLAAFRDKIVMRSPMTDLNAVLSEFVLFQKVLDRPEVLEQVAFEVVEDCYREGSRLVELRFSPNFVTEFNSLSWDDVLSGFERGVHRALATYPDMNAGLICIATRNYGAEQVDRTVEFFLKNQKRFIGVDLAGNEADFPCQLFEQSYRKAKKASARITIHAGEATGPDTIWDAIETLGAERIGHGVSSVQDPKLMKYLAEKKICLEMCPTSNWLTRASLDLRKHPLPQLLRAGIPVSINTDDPAIFGTDLREEIKICNKIMGMTESEIQTCHAHAEHASFLAPRPEI